MPIVDFTLEETSFVIMHLEEALEKAKHELISAAIRGSDSGPIHQWWVQDQYFIQDCINKLTQAVEDDG